MDILPPTKAIMPFGKYQGRPLESLPREYREWLQAQPWFREKFANYYTLIVNNYGEASETPEHNSYQVRFLEDDFCLGFMRALSPDFEARIIRDFNDTRAVISDVIAKDVQRYKKNDKDGYSKHYVQRIKALQKALSADFVLSFKFHRTFESKGIDVVLKLDVTSEHHIQRDRGLRICARLRARRRAPPR